MFRIQQISKRRYVVTAGVAALAVALVVGTFPADAFSKGFGSGGKSFRGGGFNSRVVVGPRAVYRSGRANSRISEGFRPRHGRSWSKFDGNHGNNWNGNHWNGNNWNGKRRHRGFRDRGFNNRNFGLKNVGGRHSYSYFGGRVWPHGLRGDRFFGYGPFGFGGYGFGDIGINPLGYAQRYSFSHGGFNPYYGYPYGRFNTFGGVPVSGIWGYGGYGVPLGGYSGGPLIIPVGSGAAAGVPVGGAAEPGAQSEEACRVGEYCIVRLGSGYNAPKIITLNNRDNRLAPTPVN